MTGAANDRTPPPFVITVTSFDDFDADEKAALRWLCRKTIATPIDPGDIVFLAQTVDDVLDFHPWDEALAGYVVVSPPRVEKDPSYSASQKVVESLTISLGCQLVTNQAIEAVGIAILDQLVGKQGYIAVIFSCFTVNGEYFTSGIRLIEPSLLYHIRPVSIPAAND